MSESTDNSRVHCHCGPDKTCMEKYGLPDGIHAFTPDNKVSDGPH